jgi:ATP-dependent Lon protease
MPENPTILPLVPLREVVAMPGMILPFGVGRAASIAAVQRASSTDGLLALVTQRDPAKEQIDGAEDLYPVGVVARITQIITPAEGRSRRGGALRVSVAVVERFALDSIDQDGEALLAAGRIVPTAPLAEIDLETQGLVSATHEEFLHFAEQPTSSVSIDAAETAASVGDPGSLADLISIVPEMEIATRQRVLETFDPVDRLRIVAEWIGAQLELFSVRGKIAAEVRSEIDRTQRQFILREQLKAIQRELGEEDPNAIEASELRDKIEAAGMPLEVKEKAERELDRMSRIPPMSPEQGVARTYIETLAALPWSSATTDKIELKEAGAILDADHYGLDKIKDRILEHLAVRALNESVKGPILCFVGPPGVGKTSLGRSIAKAMGRKFVRMSLGGLHDEAEIRGHRRTYIGAMPGRVISSLKGIGANNPVFLLDEIDKLGHDFRGDPAAALLEVLDPEQNSTFTDTYLEVPFDLSKVLFVATANFLDAIPPALLDRMEVINLAGYTPTEKLEIAKRYLVPKALANNGLPADAITFPDATLLAIIEGWTREAGVRDLDRQIGTAARKVARKWAEGRKRKATLSVDGLHDVLGAKGHEPGEIDAKDQVGVANGLVVSSAGGDVIAIEVSRMSGPAGLTLTGQLGDVMQESARAALTWVQAHADDLRIPESAFNSGLHLHVPAGAIPKDGPSAGITIATALASLYTDRPVRRDVAMTGEITLRGRVLPIGGLKQKILAAHRAGAKLVIIPAANEKDLDEVPAEVRDAIKIKPVREIGQVLKLALLPAPARVGKRAAVTS